MKDTDHVEDSTPDMDEGYNNKSDMRRGEASPEPSRANLVAEWLDKISKAKTHWNKDFERMRKDQQLAYRGAEKDWPEDNYVVPIIMRHINQAVSTLYAKNPKIAVELRDKVNFSVWDGRQETLQAALQEVTRASQPTIDPMTLMPMPSPPADPLAVQIVQEVMAVQSRNLMLQRIAKTLKIVVHYFMDEQSSNFKSQLKQLVRRTKTCGVGYAYLGYQRLLEKRPDITSKIEDISTQLARLRSLEADLQDGYLETDSARIEELESMKEDLAAMQEVIVREGPVFDFPRSTSIIIDPKCTQVKGFIGATWIAREMYLTCDDVKDSYNLDLKNNYKGYRMHEKNGMKYWDRSDKDDQKGSLVCVYEVWCKSTGQTFTVIDGYNDFVVEPKTPDILLERFWPVFPLTFNDVEHEDEIFPLSDVYLLRHPQMEYNRSREIRRQHRISSTPKYITQFGKLSEDDKKKLQTAAPFAVIELQAMTTGERAGDMLEQLKTAPLDPALYETNSEMEDVLRTVGSQEANLGGSSGVTATEASIGETSRSAANESNVDDLDSFLSDLLKSAGQMCLLALDKDTVKKIAGPGAQWPELSRSEIVEELDISIKAGSSGRPNAAAELAKMERAAPFLMQTAGMKMLPFGIRYTQLLDLDTDEMVAEGMPSQVALNAMVSKLGSQIQGGGPEASDPTSQGAMGGQNAPALPGTEPGPQPAYPVPQ